jgi:NADH-quinone oxidoreductase subunit J
MNFAFYISAAVAVIATLLVITRRHVVHALLYLIVSLLAVAVTFFTLGAPFIAALEVIVYAGAIMVLFVFVVMMLNLGPAVSKQEAQWLRPRPWAGPAALGAVLLAELVWLVARQAVPPVDGMGVGPKEVGAALFGPYLLCVELAGLLLLAGLVGVFHLGRRQDQPAGGTQ